MNIRILFIALFSVGCFAQQKSKIVIDASQFYGSIALHNNSIAHLIAAHPAGFILSYNKKTFGDEAWEQLYNYPDLGYSFIYQDMNNSTLGKNYGAYAHYNFYFFKRNVQLRVGQGIAYTTNPYDKVTNFRNNAYGSDILSSTYAMVNFHKENIYKGLGFKAGLTLIHYSNANFKAPNTSTNTIALNAGLTYDLDGDKKLPYKTIADTTNYNQPIHLNVAFRGGVNESDVIGLGQSPFYILSAYADKRIGRKSGFQLGADVFFSKFLKELITYNSIAFPEKNVDANDDYKRVGVFVGHELYINQMSLVTQLGYYVYYPFDFEGRMYNRMGLKRYFGDKMFAAVTLKSHAAKAEAVEFGVGIRF